MMKILILKESDIKKDHTWIHSTKSMDEWMTASIVILLKNDGTYQPVKNRYGSPELVGTIGVPLDLTTK